MITRLLPVVCLPALIVSSTPLLAADYGLNIGERDTTAINLGGFITSRNTDLRIDSATLGVGTKIDAEDDLGLNEDKSTFRSDASLRIATNHRLDLSYYDLSRQSLFTSQKDIQYQDVLFPSGSQIRSNFDFTIYKMAYVYSVLQTPKYELGLSVGLFVQDYDISIVQVGGAALNESADVTAPLPVVRARLTWQLDRDWWLRASGEIFSLEYDTIDGRLTDIIAAAEYRAFDHVSFGIGYNNTRFKLESDDSEFSGFVRVNYSGLLLYTRLSM